MAKTEWHRAINIAMMPNMCGSELWASQPSEPAVRCKLRGYGRGGNAEWRTITVTNFMMCRAFSLDSGMPLVFSHQKYTVTIIAKQEAMMSMDRGESGPVARCA